MPRGTWKVVFVAVLPAVALLGAARESPPGMEPTTGQDAYPFGTFAFTDSVTVPLTPEEAYDRFVEVDAWWDHRFSEDALRFTIDPRPGGGFLEILDEAGDGVLHATVIYAERGRALRMDGPLGLSGHAIKLVFTLNFEAAENGTRVRLELRGAGEVQEGWPDLVKSVWHHFLAERYKLYAEGTLG